MFNFLTGILHRYLIQTFNSDRKTFLYSGFKHKMFFCKKQVLKNLLQKDHLEPCFSVWGL